MNDKWRVTVTVEVDVRAFDAKDARKTVVTKIKDGLSAVGSDIEVYGEIVVKN